MNSTTMSSEKLFRRFMGAQLEAIRNHLATHCCDVTDINGLVLDWIKCNARSYRAEWYANNANDAS